MIIAKNYEILRKQLYDKNTGNMRECHVQIASTDYEIKRNQDI